MQKKSILKGKDIPLFVAAMTAGGIAGATIASQKNVYPTNNMGAIVYWQEDPYLYDPMRGYYVPWLGDWVPKLKWKTIFRYGEPLDMDAQEIIHNYHRWRYAIRHP